MFIGGTATTSSLLEWTLTELVRHPECVKKLRDEICSVSAHNSYVNEDDVEKMNYLNAIVKETLRLHPPLSIIVPRLLSEDVRLRGYDIAAGTQVTSLCMCCVSCEIIILYTFQRRKHRNFLSNIIHRTTMKTVTQMTKKKYTFCVYIFQIIL